MALNKQQFTRNQRVREITHQCGARFSVKASQFLWQFGSASVSHEAHNAVPAGVLVRDVAIFKDTDLSWSHFAEVIHHNFNIQEKEHEKGNFHSSRFDSVKQS